MGNFSLVCLLWLGGGGGILSIRICIIIEYFNTLNTFIIGTTSCCVMDYFTHHSQGEERWVHDQNLIRVGVKLGLRLVYFVKFCAY